MKLLYEMDPEDFSDLEKRGVLDSFLEKWGELLALLPTDKQQWKVRGN